MQTLVFILGRMICGLRRLSVALADRASRWLQQSRIGMRVSGLGRQASIVCMPRPLPGQVIRSTGISQPRRTWLVYAISCRRCFVNGSDFVSSLSL